MEVLDVEERGKPVYPEKNLSEPNVPNIEMADEETCDKNGNDTTDNDNRFFNSIDGQSFHFTGVTETENASRHQ